MMYFADLKESGGLMVLHERPDLQEMTFSELVSNAGDFNKKSAFTEFDCNLKELSLLVNDDETLKQLDVNPGCYAVAKFKSEIEILLKLEQQEIEDVRFRDKD